MSMRPALPAVLPSFLARPPHAAGHRAGRAGRHRCRRPATSTSGLRLLPSAAGGVAWPLMDDAVALREVQARVRDTASRCLTWKSFAWAPISTPAPTLRFFETGAALGAQAVLVGADDTEPARCAASYAALCEAAAPFGLRPNIEFMPWTAVKNIRDAARLIRDAGTPANSGLLIDALHFARSEATSPRVAEVPRGWLQYAQVCDAPAEIPTTVEGLIHTPAPSASCPARAASRSPPCWPRCLRVCH